MLTRSLYKSITCPIVVAGVLLAAGGCAEEADHGGAGGPPPGPGGLDGQGRRLPSRSVIRPPSSKSWSSSPRDRAR